jgi:hypothetical protein
MTLLTYTLPEAGKPDATQDPLIVNALTAILAWAAGTITSSNIAAEGIEPASLNKEIQRLTAGSTYSEANRAVGAEFTPSATRPTILNFLAKSKSGEAASLVVKVGGVNAGGVESLAAASGVYNLPVNGIVVPAGSAVKIEGTHVEGEVIVRTLTQ